MSIASYVHSRLHYLKTHPNRGVRITVGILLVIGGLLGALPVLGFWMLPLGLILLSVDFYWARRANVHMKLAARKTRRIYRRLNNNNQKSSAEPPVHR